MKRFDVHAWFGHWQFWDLYQKSPADLLAQMDRWEIGRALCMSLRGIIDWQKGSQETLEVAAQSGGRLLPAVTVAPGHGGGGDALHRLIDAGALGVRLYPAQHNYSLQNDFVDEICAVAAERGIFVSIPTRLMSSWRFPTLDLYAIAPLCERHPRTKFLMSGVNYVAELAALVQVMKRCGNVVYEHSCLQGFRAIAALVNEVGADRILFGTGALLHYPACNVAKLDSAAITPAQRAAIAWQNAEQLLGLNK